MTPWSEVPKSPVFDFIKSDWLKLIDNPQTTEREILPFVRDHAGFFSRSMALFESVFISELRLGADFRTDFVLGESKRSYGFSYTLIELESPNTPVYTKKGIPSARLSGAMQQIRDWKNWIKEHPSEASKIFPSWAPQFNYLIVIGRRTDPHIKRRNQISSTEPFEIISYDRLTDYLFRPHFKNLTTPSTAARELDLNLDNAFSNPFHIAYSDTEWRSIVNDHNLKNYHMVSENIGQLLANRRYNQKRLEEFQPHLETIPKDYMEKYIAAVHPHLANRH